MKMLDLNLIWNYSREKELYRPNRDFLSAFSSYLKINKQGDLYSISESLSAEFFSKKFNIHDEITYSSYGRKHYIRFNEKVYLKIINYLVECKINFALIDYNTCCIYFENFNENNGYYYFLELIKKSDDSDYIKTSLNEMNYKIKMGYKIVGKTSFVEILDMESNEILKLVFSNDYLDYDLIKKVCNKNDEILFDDYEYISEFSELAKKLMGSFENDIISVNKNSYKILNVKNINKFDVDI